MDIIHLAFTVSRLKSGISSTQRHALTFFEPQSHFQGDLKLKNDYQYLLREWRHRGSSDHLDEQHRRILAFTSARDNRRLPDLGL